MRRRLTRWPALLAPHLLFLVPELLMAAGPFVITSAAGAAERPRFRMPDFFYGGQALIEGVMMRGRTTVAMSVRPPSGEIVTLSEPLPEALRSGRWIKVPFVRGAFVLYETLVLGTRMLMRSAAIAAEGDDIEISRPMMIGTMVFSIGFAVAIFFVLPLFLSTFAEGPTESDVVANFVEGGIRLVVFVAYIGLIGLMGDVKRVFAYHGAEHKAISAHEARRPLTPAEVDRFSTAHTRCGTTFLLIVVVISIFFFSLIPRGGVPLPLLFASRIVLIPVIAAVSYELVRFGARHYGNRLVRALYAPGLWLQSLTTRPPDHSMLEVSIASLESCLASDRRADAEGRAAEPTAEVVDPTTGVLP
ncbi:MAG TPA: DUF1385 domain-containing protein [Candidatus Limnocylindria bacterium]|nr:DUF1385 domain-containing protein [Candidatus Limnocylindria bacterium]